MVGAGSTGYWPLDCSELQFPIQYPGWAGILLPFPAGSCLLSGALDGEQGSGVGCGRVPTHVHSVPDPLWPPITCR